MVCRALPGLALGPALVPALVSGLAGCAALGTPPVQPGQTEAEVVQRFGHAPTARRVLPGGTQLEFATGPEGRTTWLVSLDAEGRVEQARQALGESQFASFQVHQSGLDRDAVLQALGTPGERRGIWRGGEIWSWRYPTHDCLWFQVTLDRDGRVKDSGYGPDPRCDAPNDRP